MPFQLPAAHWTESPTTLTTGLAQLRPYQTAGGYWVFLVPGTQPGGSTAGALVPTADYNTLTTATTVGRRFTRNGGGTVFLR